MRELSDRDNELHSLGYERGYAAGYRAAQAAMPPREPTLVGWICDGPGGDLEMLRWEKQATIYKEPAQFYYGGRPREWVPLYRIEQTGGKAMPATGLSSPDHAGTAGPPDHQSAATSVSDGATAAPSEPTASVTDGPAADPIADLCARLRDKTFLPEFWRQLEAADALERLAAENGPLHDTLAAERFRAERAEAERDALRECVRAADAMRAGYSVMWGERPTSTLDAYDAARAKVKP